MYMLKNVMSCEIQELELKHVFILFFSLFYYVIITF